MPLLEASHLSKSFGIFRAVTDVSFQLREREILGVLGPNGAGKTTLIQMLLGALTPTAGEVTYFGTSLKENRGEILEKINFSSTYTHLPWDLTVKQNLTVAAYLYDIKDRNKRIAKISTSFRLDPLLSKRLHTLSAGQMTRVNLAKSFINFPQILLLDEPTASLDPEIASAIREELLRQRKEFGVSIIITSHNMAEVEEICDRVIFLKDGHIIADDTPRNLAHSVNVAHVELLIAGDMARALDFCREKNIESRVLHDRLIADVKEKEIPEFLRGLMSNNIFYDEISIDKPTLEDYFLRIAKNEIDRKEK